MFTLSYTHEYGTDTTLYATLELAERAAGAILVEYFVDYADEQLAELLNAGKYGDAVNHWMQLDNLEYISIQEVNLVSEVPMPPRVDYFDED